MTTVASRSRASTTPAAYVVRATVALAAAAALLWFLLPRLTGESWTAIGGLLATIHSWQVAVLAALWAAGIVIHSFVLTGALPGLSRRRALTLNLTGSAVSNVAPLGGALGVALNLAMVRAWRFRTSAFAAFTVVTNIWDVLSKLTLPLIALLGLLLDARVTSPTLRTAAVLASVLLVVLVGVVTLSLASERVAGSTARALGWVVSRVPRRLRERLADAPSAFLGVRTRVQGVVATTWPQLSVAMAGYLALQLALLWACLATVGAREPVTVVLAAFAVERLLSLVVVTPGGAGIAEVGTAGTLLALGGAPLGVAAGVLLYRAFTFFLEIPVGGLWLGGWALARWRRHPDTPDESPV